jgi:hypothetical protein
MWTELAMASWETIWHRTALMGAMSQSSAALMAGKEPEDVLRPFHRKATANAKRLRNA